jgi:hypothetical protein
MIEVTIQYLIADCDAVVEWCDEHYGDSWGMVAKSPYDITKYYPHPYPDAMTVETFLLPTEEDAVLFKMRWG